MRGSQDTRSHEKPLVGRPLSLQSVTGRNPGARSRRSSSFQPQRIHDQPERRRSSNTSGLSGLKVLRRYCPRCGSPLTTEPDLTPELYMVKAGRYQFKRMVRAGVGALHRPAQAPGLAQCPARSNSKAILKSERGPMKHLPGYFRRPEGAVRHGGDAHLRMARRSTRPHGPHDQGERGALPEGDGQRLQDRLAGIYLRDRGVGWRDGSPEEPAAVSG